MMMYYFGLSNPSIENKTAELCEAYKGHVKEPFNYDQNHGAFTALLSFPSDDQEDRFKEEIKNYAQLLGVTVEFGGIVTL